MNTFIKAMLWLLPKRMLTAAVGQFAQTSFSRRLIHAYTRHYNIDITEAEKSPSDYHSLAEFFSRGLVPGARPVSALGVVAPVDGTVSELGRIENGRLLQAKGSSYSLSALVGSASDAGPYLHGDYITIYLSPRDYHRVHAPCAGTIQSWRFIPGRLFPVNRHGVAQIEGLFTKNERLIAWLQTTYGQVGVAQVGATIVGSIRTPYGPSPARAFHPDRRVIQEGSELNRTVARGEEIGYFVFGSTVILLFPPGVIRKFKVQKGDFVRMGESIADLLAEGQA